MIQNGICEISQKSFHPHSLIEGHNLNMNIMVLIQNDYPNFSKNSLISIAELNRYRRKYLENIVTDEAGDLSKVQQEVIESINANEVLSDNIEFDIQTKIRCGQKIADNVAKFGGSWRFIIGFFLCLIFWIIINTVIMVQKPFDPYPFILLNLILSCLAAIQAPIIMMSQNRREDRDRKRSENDYKIDLKAELEIRLLHDKMDHILIHQNKHFIEIIKIQMDLMEDILNKTRAK